MRKRIIILIHYMELGGVETSLIGLLNALNPEIVDIDLFVYSHQGAMMKYIPDYVNLLKEDKAYSMFERPMVELLRKGQFKVLLARLHSKTRHRRYLKHNRSLKNDASISQFLGDCVTPVLPDINPGCQYDLCISYMNPHNIGIDKVNAKQRLAWIHTDYSQIDINTAAELPVWGGYNYIASISDDVTQSFIKVFPSLKDKVIYLENIIPKELIIQKSREICVRNEYTGTINILSIGRFCEAKNYDNVPDIARRMITLGIKDLKWYIIGYGGNEDLIRQRIAEAGMEEHVILLGKKENPYPYIKACDIYVQPSRYEGKSITVREAQILCKPVAVTNYPTASSQINDGVDGVIVPLDNEGCARGLADFIADTARQQRVIEYLRTHDYANTSEVEKIYSLLK